MRLECSGDWLPFLHDKWESETLIFSGDLASSPEHGGIGAAIKFCPSCAAQFLEAVEDAFKIVAC